MAVATETAERIIASSAGRSAPRPFGTVLVPLDGSSFAEAALAPALAIAERAGAGVVLMQAAVPAPVPGVDHSLDIEFGKTDARVSLARAAARIAAGGEYGGEFSELVVVPAPGAAPDPARGILTAVNDLDVGLVVMTTHGRAGLRRAVFGSVAEAVVRGSRVPVLLIHPHAEPHGERARTPATKDPFYALERRQGGGACVLAALDGTRQSEAVLGPAARLATVLGVGVELLRVLPPDHALHCPDIGLAGEARGARDYLREKADLLLRRHPALPFVRTVLTIAEHDRIPAAIADQAGRAAAGTIALASHGRAGLSRLLFGSVTARVVAATSTPVLAVPGHDAEGGT